MFTRIDGGVLSTGNFIEVCVKDALHAIVIINNDSRVVVTQDGGNTWTLSDTGSDHGGGDAGMTVVKIASDPSSLTYVAMLGNLSGNNVVVTSTDGGLTWTKTSTGYGKKFAYSVGHHTAAGLFFYFGVEIGPNLAAVYTSPDGITWTPSSTEATTGVDVFLLYYTKPAEGNTCVAAGFLGGQVSLVVSADGVTWTPTFSNNSNFVGIYGYPPSSLATDGGNKYYYAALDINGGKDLLVSLDNGATWSIKSGGSSGNTPPFNSAVVYFAGRVYTASDLNTGLVIAASSDDGNSWVTNDLSTIGDFTDALGLSATSSTVYAWGGGIASSTDGVTFTVALASQSGAVQVADIESKGGLTLAVGSDADGSPAIWLDTGPSLPLINVSGKFVPSSTYKAIEIGRVGDIIPRVWPSKKNITVFA